MEASTVLLRVMEGKKQAILDLNTETKVVEANKEDKLSI